MIFEILGIVLVIIIIIIVAQWFKRSLKLRNIEGRYVFITGCDSGFGKLLASRLDSLGVNVFAGCYTKNALEDYQKKRNSIKAVALDLTDRKSIENAYQFVRSNLPESTGLWALVNNAGTLGHFGHVTWLSEEDFQRPLAVNLFGMVWMVQTFLPLILKSEGRIVNMTSGAGKIAGLNMGAYSISKFGAEAFSDTLRRELYKTGVSVHTIEPGTFSTGLVDIPAITTAIYKNFEKLDVDMKEYYGAGYVEKITTTFKNLLDGATSSKLHKVIDVYEHAITSRYPQIRYVVGVDCNIMMFLNSYFPERLLDMIICAYLPTPKAKI
ncbi:short-chain dehydrogenase/reductase family 9C member 7-like [Pecten maximus]|uniref:short-chain dehydrogenase/reductase family 9C member 7-like n=1 Tax=Pecten maximus TaxID=6579 RepID=UPI001458F661|nr:short-chain dehydrogenase/reductase family 9C member 7-like [Pecten maximus]